MRIDIAGLTATGGERAFAFVGPAADFGAIADGVSFDGEVRVKGNVYFTGDVYRVGGEIAVTKCFDCDRCLAAVRREEVYTLAEDFSRHEHEDALLLSEAGDIELADVVRETIIAAQPTANYCRDDCKGLCPVCGKNLNDGDCGCERVAVDPRLAALKDFVIED